MTELISTQDIDQITGSRRFRRLRKSPWVRGLVRENTLTTDDLVWTVFVTEGTGVREPLNGLPGVYRYSVDVLAEEAQRAESLGIRAMATFPNIDPSKRDETGSNILEADNLINQATTAIKKATTQMGVITDVALDPFTSHGQDGILRDGVIINDETVNVIAQAAINQAKAGSDIIAPSEMMDGRIGAIRQALDGAGYQDVAILSYTTKFASAFYGPYREAIGTSGLLKGDKASYYISPANGEEALREAEQDLLEGADMLMVKPGIAYLDILQRIKSAFNVPTFAYQVSGEYAMIEAAAAQGFIDGDKIWLETMMGFKRAGADGIWTYRACHIAEMLRKGMQATA